jgi:hypothetical protein
MTSPIVIQQPGFGQAIQEGLAPLINAIFARQQMGMERQKLEIERQKAEASIAQAGAATSESRARTKATLAELEQKNLDLRARDLAAQQFITLSTDPSGFSPEAVARLQADLMKRGDTKVREPALAAFNLMVGDREKMLSEAAKRQSAQTEATVDTATQGARIEAGQLAGQIAQAQLGAAQTAQRANVADARLKELEATRDPQRVARAQAIWELGRTWGEARKAAGLAAGGIPDDAIFSMGTAVKLDEAGRKAQNFALQMVPANAIINSLTRNGTRVDITTSVQRAANSNALGIAINEVKDAEQQQILQAGLQYVMAYRFFMSGQQSSDREYLNMMKVTLELPGDTDEVIRQKRVMRQLQIDAVGKAAEGTVSPVAVLDETIQQMRLEGMEPRFIAAMQHERNLAANNERRKAAGVADTLSVSRSPGDSARLIQFGDSVIRVLGEKR